MPTTPLKAFKGWLWLWDRKHCIHVKSDEKRTFNKAPHINQGGETECCRLGSRLSAFYMLHQTLKSGAEMFSYHFTQVKETHAHWVWWLDSVPGTRKRNLLLGHRERCLSFWSSRLLFEVNTCPSHNRWAANHHELICMFLVQLAIM